MLATESNSDLLLVDKMRSILLRSQKHLQAQGVTIRAWRDTTLPYFQSLSYKKKLFVLQHAEIFASSLEESGMEFFQAEQRFLWKALSLFGFMPPMGLFEKLRPDRSIEIYDLEWHQIWRNIVTIELCSYTLEEVVCVPAYLRYAREAAMQSEVIQKVTMLLTGEKPEVHDPGLARHIISETNSELMLKLDAKHELLSVLKNRSGQIVAWLVMSDADICEQAPAPNPYKFSIV